MAFKLVWGDKQKADSLDYFEATLERAKKGYSVSPPNAFQLLERLTGSHAQVASSRPTIGRGGRRGKRELWAHCLGSSPASPSAPVAWERAAPALSEEGECWVSRGVARSQKMAGPRSCHHHRPFSRNRRAWFPRRGASDSSELSHRPAPGCQGPGESGHLPPSSLCWAAGRCVPENTGCLYGEGLVRKWLILQKQFLDRNFRSY